MSSKNSLSELVYHLSRELLKMNPGQLARLRRMDIKGPGVMEYWQVIAATKFDSNDRVMQLVKTMAILTPKGPPGENKRLHIKENTLGQILSQLEYPETRLMRLIAMPYSRRSESIERVARWISSKHTGGINCFDIACFLLSKDVKHTSRLAEDYYRHQYQRQSTEVTQ